MEVLEGNRRLESKLSSPVLKLLASTAPGGHSADAYNEALARMLNQLFVSYTQFEAAGIKP